MMVKVLVYGYATGVFSSRRLERRLHEDLAFRMLAAGNFPKHDPRFPCAAPQGVLGAVRAGGAPGARDGAGQAGHGGHRRPTVKAKHHASVDARRLPHTAAMAVKMQTDAGRAAYRKRKWIAEPPNGWIKSVLEFRQFSLRGAEPAANGHLDPRLSGHLKCELTRELSGGHSPHKSVDNVDVVDVLWM
jgi:hypothetical protein